MALMTYEGPRIVEEEVDFEMIHIDPGPQACHDRDLMVENAPFGCLSLYQAPDIIECHKVLSDHIEACDV